MQILQLLHQHTSRMINISGVMPVFIFFLISFHIGLSNDLARRFKQYFEKNALFHNKDTGL